MGRGHDPTLPEVTAFARHKRRRSCRRVVPKRGSEKPKSPAKATDARSKEPPDWQGEVLSRVRHLIQGADPDAVEERKWRKPSNPAGVPVWSHDGILCTGETYKNHVRLTFAEGASLPDPKGLFNSGLEGHTMRAIVFRDGDTIDEEGFRSLIRAAAARNAASVRR
jgi:hypothetical protein